MRDIMRNPRWSNGGKLVLRWDLIQGFSFIQESWHGLSTWLIIQFKRKEWVDEIMLEGK